MIDLRLYIRKDRDVLKNLYCFPGGYNLKSLILIFTGVACVVSLFWGCDSPKPEGTTILTNDRGPDANAKGKVEHYSTTAAFAMNQWILEIKTNTDFSSRIVETTLEKISTAKVEDLVKVPTDEDRFAVVVYNQVAKALLPLEGILWKLGGIAERSEHIYTALLTGLQSIGYNNHLYSAPVKEFMKFLLFPPRGDNKNETRYKKISDLQKDIKKYLPILDESLETVENFATESLDSKTSFLYDRALIAGGRENYGSDADYFVSEKDRFAGFTKAHVYAGLSYGKMTSGSLRLIQSYKLDSLPDFLNQLFFKAVVGSKVQLPKLSSWFKHDPRKNIKLNNPMTIAETLEEGRYSSFLTLKTGSDLRNAARKDFISAVSFDIDYIEELKKQNGDENSLGYEYVVDKDQVLNDPAYSASRFEKVRSALEGPVSVIDPVTGQETRVDFSKLFSLGSDLKAYFPSSSRANFEVAVGRVIDIPGSGGKQSYNFRYGRVSQWPDETFNGFLSSNKSVYEQFRILIYNNDLDLLTSVVTYFVY